MKFSPPALSNGWKIFLLVLSIIGSAISSQAQFTPPTQAVYAVMVDADGNIVAPTNVNFGAGSGFPLTNNVSAAGRNITDGGTVVFSNGHFRTIGTNNPMDEAVVVRQPGGGHYYRYVPRIATNRSDLLSSVTTSNLLLIYPGQLVYNDIGTGEGNTYISFASLYVTNYQPHTTNSFPWPGEGGESTNFWRLFVKKGDQGAAGADGAAGSDGVGNLIYGIWDSTVTYTPSTSAPVVVSYEGRWYDLIKTNASLNEAPTLNTNVWAISIDKGSDGELHPTNIIFRGAWDAGEAGYASNDVVQYAGNLFVKWTNAVLTGGSPAIDAASVGYDNEYWDVYVSRGPQGIQGPDGNQINTYYYYNYYNVVSTNRTTNEASAVNTMLAMVGQDNGTNIFAWVDYVLVGGTNVLNFDGTNLTLNGSVIPYLSDIESGSEANPSGVYDPFIVSPENVVTLDPTNGWLQAYYPTGSTTIALADLSDTNNGAFIRLNLYAGPNSVGINYSGTEALTILTNDATPLVFDIPTYSASVTNWRVYDLLP